MNKKRKQRIFKIKSVVDTKLLETSSSYQTTKIDVKTKRITKKKKEPQSSKEENNFLKE